MTRISRVRIVLLVLLAALACFSAAAATVFAVPGDSIANATSLNDYLASSLTTELVPGSQGTGYYYFRVLLASGSTLKADFASATGVEGLKAVLSDEGVTFLVDSVALSSKLCRLSFTAPAQGMYNIWVPSNTPGTFTVSPTVQAPLLRVYRFRNKINGYYLWSADPAERVTINTTLSRTWTEEGEAYSINPTTNTSTLMRFRNIRGGFYLYSADPTEWADINAKLSASWVQEGPAYSISRSYTPGAKTVWRFRNRGNGTYLYSADPTERADINARLGASWQEEGEAYYLAP